MAVGEVPERFRAAGIQLDLPPVRIRALLGAWWATRDVGVLIDPEEFVTSLFVTLFQAEQTELPRVPANGWDELIVGDIEVCRVPGDHYSMLARPQVSGLAERLATRLNELAAGMVSGPQDRLTPPEMVQLALSSVLGQARSGGEGEVVFTFNPKEFSISKSAQWQRRNQKGTGSAAMPSFTAAPGVVYGLSMNIRSGWPLFSRWSGASRYTPRSSASSRRCAWIPPLPIWLGRRWMRRERA